MLKYIVFKSSDGVISTSKTAVDICIGLIGIMTLFMGFMSIAEKSRRYQFPQPINTTFFLEIISGNSRKDTLLLVI